MLAPLKWPTCQALRIGDEELNPRVYELSVSVHPEPVGSGKQNGALWGLHMTSKVFKENGRGLFDDLDTGKQPKEARGRGGERRQLRTVTRDGRVRERAVDSP